MNWDRRLLVSAVWIRTTFRRSRVAFQKLCHHSAHESCHSSEWMTMMADWVHNWAPQSIIRPGWFIRSVMINSAGACSSSGHCCFVVSFTCDIGTKSICNTIQGLKGATRYICTEYTSLSVHPQLYVGTTNIWSRRVATWRQQQQQRIPRKKLDVW